MTAQDRRAELSAAEALAEAVALGEAVRGTTAPNPWVGAVIVTADGQHFGGATEPPPGRHAEIVALDAARAAGADMAGATLYSTLEPCSHTGRTPPCVEAIIASGVGRVHVGVADPDPQVSGRGIAALTAAGIEVATDTGDPAGNVDAGLNEVVAAFADGPVAAFADGPAGAVVDGPVSAVDAATSLRPYLHQRRTGRPWVVLKLAATLDGRIGAVDGSSQWITSPDARADAHALRARCDAVLVGAGTVRADNPALTVRDAPGTDPRRFVLGTAPPSAAIHPCTQVGGPLPEVLAQMAADGVVELLVEGGAQVAGDLHRAGLVDEYVVYLAPALLGGDDGLSMLAGPGAPTIGDLWRGTISEVRRVGVDLRLTIHRTATVGSDEAAQPSAR